MNDGSANGGVPAKGERLSADQVSYAIASMTAAEKTRVEKVARYFANSMSEYGWYKDLINETALRALEGRRAWLHGQTPAEFYAKTMRSIVFEWREKRKADGEARREAALTAPEADSTEEEIRFAERKKKVLAEFDDDPVARQIVVGMMDGRRGEALRLLSGLDPVGFASAQKRIKRRLHKFFGSELE